MSRLKIVRYGHPVLRERAEEIKTWGTREREFVAQMFEALEHSDGGIGLASNQVAVAKRLFVVDLGSRLDDDSEPMVFVNPEIVEESVEDEPYEEGCLSIPGLRAEVYRPERIKVVARDGNFEPFELTADGLLARVIQHELDHLNGRLFVDLLEQKKRKELTPALARMRRQTLEEMEEEAPTNK